MTSLEINKKIIGESVEISIDNLENDFVYTYYKNWCNFKVVPFSSGEIGNYLSNYREVYEYYKKIVQTFDNNVVVKGLV